MKKRKVRKVVKTGCRALVPLETEKVRGEYMKRYKRRKKVLEKLEAEMREHSESDESEYRKFMARTFGTEQTKQRELAEQLNFFRERYEKIKFLAKHNKLAMGRYCFNLHSKVTEAKGFWEILEDELDALVEAERAREEALRKEEEEAHKREEEFRRAHPDVFFDDDGGDEWDDGDDDWDSPESLAEKMFKEMFGHLFGEDNPLGEEEKADPEELKHLYRELCLLYHPDRIGTHDSKTQTVWNSIQEAYQRGDVNRLRAIRAAGELEGGNGDVSCSEMDGVIDEIDVRIYERREELRRMKREPYWGFSSWTDRKLKGVVKEIREEFAQLNCEMEYDIREIEKKINKVVRWKPAPPPKSRAQRMEESYGDAPDLFGFVRS